MKIIRRERYPHIAGEYQFRDDGTYRFVGDSGAKQPNGWRSDYVGTYTMTPEDLHLASCIYHRSGGPASESCGGDPFVKPDPTRYAEHIKNGAGWKEKP